MVENYCLGRGESAALSIATNYSDGLACIASNNLSDIEKYHIPLYTTATILRECFDHGIITYDRADQLWKNMLENGDKMPDPSFNEYLTQYNNDKTARY